MSAFDDQIAELQTHRNHCDNEMARTVTESSPMVSNTAQWREEVTTLDLVIPALVEIQTKLNEIVAYLVEAEKKLKVDQQGLADLPEVL